MRNIFAKKIRIWKKRRENVDFRLRKGDIMIYKSNPILKYVSNLISVKAKASFLAKMLKHKDHA